MLQSRKSLSSSFSNDGLHNICIQHGLQWEIESPDGVEEDEMTLPLDPTNSGHSVRQSDINNYVN